MSKPHHSKAERQRREKKEMLMLALISQMTQKKHNLLFLQKVFAILSLPVVNNVGRSFKSLLP